MKKTIIAMCMIFVVMASLGFAVAGKQLETPAYERAHNGNAQHLYLYEKNPSTWEVLDGAWGKMMYQDNKFVFNGHKLVSGEDYSLIYYPDFDNKYTLNFECTVGCSGIYTHTMEINSFDESGFSGTGYYNANNAITWDVSGTSLESFTLTYNNINLGYTVTCTGSNCAGPGQTFDLTVTDIGSAVWPHPIEILETGIVNEDGNVNIKGEFDFASIPWSIDWNEGAKIWLVLSGNIVDDKLSGWNPTEYLFENNLINEDSESVSYTKYHGNGIYSTTHILRKDDMEAKKVKPDKTKGPACYKLMGPKWPNTPTYVAQSQDLLDIATISIGTWNDETGFDLLGGGIVDEFAGFNDEQDYKNSYSMGNYPLSGVIAVCRTWYDSYTNEIVEYDIMFDTDFAWGDATTSGTPVMDLQNIATHEIGHGLGLSDLYQRPCVEQTMFGYSSYGDTEKRTLESGDIAGIQALYGTA